jgi:hypothetical protein
MSHIWSTYCNKIDALMVALEVATHAQVELVLNSNTFRNAEILRRLLKFLAEKSIAGEADGLKEYAVGIDALGKPQSYDPRQDSVVRIQIGRLRHKLADYYKFEGKDDPILLDIPKGHFKITWESRQVPAIEPVAPAALPAVTPAQAPRWSNAQRTIMAALGLWSVFATALGLRQYQEAAPIREAWTSELRELWAPILESDRPLVVAVAAPMFIGFQGSGLFRIKSLNRWEDVLASPKIQAVAKSLNNPPLLQRYDFTGAGDMNAALKLSSLLNLSGLKITTVRSNQVSWRQLVDNNVLFVGAPRASGDPLQKVPVDLDFVLREDGVHDLKAVAGQPSLYADDYPSIANTVTSTADDGEIYALVNRMPGPLGLGDVQTFNSNYSPGTFGAVQSFTHPAFAHELVTKLRKSDGRLPRYFQLVLNVKYRDSLPTQITYVAHRELRPEQAPRHIIENK